MQFIDSIMLRKTTALKSKPWIFLSIGLIEILFQINLHVAVELTSNIILCVRDSDVAVEFLGCSWNLDLNHSGGRKKKHKMHVAGSLEKNRSRPQEESCLKWNKYTQFGLRSLCYFVVIV